MIWTPPYLQYKLFSSNVTIGALRAFYMSVHPDFFAQHPKIQVSECHILHDRHGDILNFFQKVNESSLKRLNHYLDAIQCSRQVRNVKPTNVKFYFRKQTTNSTIRADGM